MATLQLTEKTDPAESPGILEQDKTEYWFCWMPAAGVRYYTYTSHPAPVEGRTVKASPRNPRAVSR